ncbi:MAG: integrase core domain-containing protein [Thermoleophilia bacterium]
MAESIIGLYKTELIRRRGLWRTLEDVEYATLEWVDWFNYRRLFGSIGHIPPAELEKILNPGRALALEPVWSASQRYSVEAGPLTPSARLRVLEWSRRPEDERRHSKERGTRLSRS